MYFFRFCNSTIRSSTLCRTTNLRTRQTCAVCPRRTIRLMHWSSLAEFHQGSTKKTVEAATRFNPSPPAFMLMSKTVPLSVSSAGREAQRNSFKTSIRLASDSWPSSLKYGTPMAARRG